MTGLRVTLQAFSDVLGVAKNSTFLIACLMDLHGSEEIIEVKVLKNGQDVLEFFHETDRPESTIAIVGLQIAIGPNLNRTGCWEIEPILDFKKIKLMLDDSSELDLYAYDTFSGRTLSDNLNIDKSRILCARSIYRASNAEAEDFELQAYQLWMAKVIGQLVNEACGLNISETPGENP